MTHKWTTTAILVSGLLLAMQQSRSTPGPVQQAGVGASAAGLAKQKRDSQDTVQIVLPGSARATESVVASNSATKFPGAVTVNAELEPASFGLTPFGFRCGMTVEELTALVGKAAIEDSERGVLILSTAPKPSPLFDSYRLFVSPHRKVVRIDGRNSGEPPVEELNQTFAYLHATLTRLHGTARFTDLRFAPNTALWELKSTLPENPRAVVLMASISIARQAPNGSPLLLAYECAGFEPLPQAKSKTMAASSKKSFTAQPPVSSWTVLKSWSGNGTKETEAFATTTSEWRISWMSRDEVRPGTGILQIYVKDASGKLTSIAANKRGPGQDVSYLHAPPGKYYLTINSGNVDWTVRVETQQQQ